MTSKKSPVLLIIFNRIDTAGKVFQAIRNYQPEKLYIAGDGPRPSMPADAVNCAEARSIAGRVDWPCEVHTFFREENLGPRYGIIKTLDWFFENEEQGIVLEHDCLPDPSFFNFCNALLERYKEDNRIMHFTRPINAAGNTDASYYFSNISSIWGWASWRRVWQLCDPEMKKFPAFERQDMMINIFPERKVADWAMSMARRVYERKMLTWDYPLGFSIIINNGLCITPNINLVSNIGFGEGALHTKDACDVHANVPAGVITEIVHPKLFMADRNADLYQLSLSMPKNKPVSPIISFLKRIMERIKAWDA